MQPTPMPPRRFLLKQDPELPPNEYILEIDNSSLEYFNACARSAEYQLIQARGFSGNSATRYGHAIHQYLEDRIKGKTEHEASRAMSDLFQTFPPLQPDEWRTVDHAMNAMAQYEAFYKQQDRLRVLHRTTGEPLVELPFRLPLTVIDIDAAIPNPRHTLMDVPDDGTTAFHCARIHVYWTGRIDLVCQYDEALAVLDHKTSSMLGSLFYKDFELSSQTRGYVWSARRLPDLAHLPLVGQLNRFVLDVIVGRKPTRTGVAHEFERHLYTYTDESIDEWAFDTTHIVADFLSHLVRGYFPMQTKWCVNKYGLCPFHDVCTLPKHLRASFLQQTFAPVTWSPLT